MSADHRLARALALLGLAFGASPSGALAAATVQSMVVGASGQILAGPRSVSAAGASVPVGRRRCAVAAGTPLAVLANLRRLGGPAFSVRDYGRCNSSPQNSALLFVYALGGETNVGRDGWEYKVGGVAGSAGAANPSGPRGDGRLLSSGQQLLWFWCHTAAGGCQRTLSVSAAGSVSRGGRLSVTVRGYDNEGRGAAIAGAIVRLGSDFATTNRSGRATLIAPGRRGSYSLSASRRGLVPAFPETIAVR
jgi:hypothetical protein